MIYKKNLETKVDIRDLLDDLSLITGMPKSKLASCINALMHTVIEHLKDKKVVSIPTYGEFYTVNVSGIRVNNLDPTSPKKFVDCLVPKFRFYTQCKKRVNLPSEKVLNETEQEIYLDDTNECPT